MKCDHMIPSSATGNCLRVPGGFSLPLSVASLLIYALPTEGLEPASPSQIRHASPYPAVQWAYRADLEPSTYLGFQVVVKPLDVHRGID